MEAYIRNYKTKAEISGTADMFVYTSSGKRRLFSVLGIVEGLIMAEI